MNQKEDANELSPLSQNCAEFLKTYSSDKTYEDARFEKVLFSEGALPFVQNVFQIEYKHVLRKI